MNGTLALLLVVAGLILFVIGDALWLVRYTLSRPMNLRATGGLVVGGVLLMVVGLAGVLLR